MYIRYDSVMEIHTTFLRLLVLSTCFNALAAEPIKPQKVLQPHSQNVLALAFSPDGSMLASGGADGVVKILSPQDGTELMKFDGAATQRNELIFSDDATRLFVITPTGVMAIDVPHKAIRHRFQADIPVNAISLSPDGRQLAAVGKGSIKVWLVNSGAPVATVDAHEGKDVTAVDYSDEGDRIVTLGADKNICTWNIQSFQPLKTFEAGYRGLCVAFLPGGNEIITSADDGKIRSHRTDSGDEAQIAQTSAPGTSMILTPDGRRVIVAGIGNEPGIIELKAQKVLDVHFAGHEGKCTAVASSADGVWLASGDQSGKINVYRLPKAAGG